MGHCTDYIRVRGLGIDEVMQVVDSVSDEWEQHRILAIGLKRATGKYGVECLHVPQCVKGCRQNKLYEAHWSTSAGDEINRLPRGDDAATKYWDSRYMAKTYPTHKLGVGMKHCNIC